MRLAHIGFTQHYFVVSMYLYRHHHKHFKDANHSLFALSLFLKNTQIISVCIGIDHLMKRRRRVVSTFPISTATATTEKSRMDVGETSPCCRVGGEQQEDEKENSRSTDEERAVRHDENCRLCDSTRRVLRIARAHGGVAHDVSNCEACRMWSMVRARYAHLREVRSAADNGITLGSSRVVVVG